MPIQFVSGDLFANRFEAKALAHGCNCQGSMGAGVATGFRDRYPEMYAEYRRRCKANPREFNLGDAWLWKTDDKPWVFNLGTQEGIWRARASYEAIEAALRTMRVQADREGVRRIAIPKIGVGYGGLSWRKVRAIVEKAFAGWTGNLCVYEEYRARRGGCGRRPGGCPNNADRGREPPQEEVHGREGVAGRDGPRRDLEGRGALGPVQPVLPPRGHPASRLAGCLRPVGRGAVAGAESLRA